MRKYPNSRSEYAGNYLVIKKHDGNIAILGYRGPGGKLVIPAAIRGLPVVEIRKSAFQKSHLTELTIPYGVTIIGAWAFSHNELARVIIPPSVNYIGKMAFGDNQLREVTIPAGVGKIESNPFSSNPLLESISVVPENPAYTSVDGVLFSKDRRTLIAFPPGKGSGYEIPPWVITIGKSAFAWSSISRLDIPPSVTSIEETAFAGNYLSQLCIPSGVASLGAWAFYNSHITSLTLCRGLINIDNWAFSRNELSRIEIPESVVSIIGNPFNYNPGLEAFSVAPENPSYTSVDGVLFSKNHRVIVAYPTVRGGHYTVPPGVKLIEQGAFYSCNLSSVLFPQSLRSILKMAFAWNQLSELTIPPNVSRIGIKAFEHNPLTQVIMPANVNISASFGDGLADFYCDGKRAGVYINTGKRVPLRTVRDRHTGEEVDPRTDPSKYPTTEAIWTYEENQESAG
ncbi:MAG: leucine-rich repeat domain-containing protein [Treponema sp.]|jgi:hypothetical protein|nr:leucine-rich repeat domain-containing protein [Treponema sp.]